MSKLSLVFAGSLVVALMWRGESRRGISLDPGAQRGERRATAPAGWLTYADPQRRFRFSYPSVWGQPGRGTDDGFGDRVAAIRFSEFSAGLREGQLVLGGEAVLTRGFVLVDVQALGGLYDSMTLGAMPSEMRKRILQVLPPLNASNLCRELAKEQHLDLAQPEFADLSPQLRDAIAGMDRIRGGRPTVIRCNAVGDTVTFHKEVTAAFGQKPWPRQQIYGAIRFLRSPFSSFQLVRASAAAPTAETLRTIASVVDSLEISS